MSRSQRAAASLGSSRAAPSTAATDTTVNNNSAVATADSVANPGGATNVTINSTSTTTTTTISSGPASVYTLKKKFPEPAFFFVPKPNVWRSYGSEKVIAAEAPPKMDRPTPTTMHFTLRRDFFIKRRQLHNFLNRDAADDGATYLRPTKDASKEDPWVLRMESEASVQAVKTKSNSSTQVPHFRKVDFSVQVQPEIVDACAPPPIKPSFADGTATAGEEADAEEAKERNKRARSFLEKVMPRMLHHLTQSAAVPLFQDDYQLLMDEDASAIVSNREESDLIEAGNFSHHYTRDRTISCIDWKPGPKMILAVASIKATDMQSRFEAALDVEPSLSIIWNLHEQTNPQLLLESPTEVFSLKFHPKPLSQLVIGGLANGQICLWDMSRAPIDPKKGGGGSPAGSATKDGSSTSSGGAGGVSSATTGNQGGGGGGTATSAVTSSLVGRVHLTMQEEIGTIPPLPLPVRGHTLEIASDEHVVSRLQPIMISRIENSHRRAVHDICWLPDSLECAFDGRATTQEQIVQFATISEDGFVFIWDLRPEHLPSDRLRKLKHQGRATGDEHAKVWVPLLRYQLPRSEGLGDLVGLRLHLEGRTQGGQGPPSYLFMATTVEGEICCGNWGPKPGTEDATAKSLTGFDAGGPAPINPEKAKVVRYVAPAHAGPVWSLHRHPLLPDIFLTVGDWGFKVWRVGVEVPILSSPMGEQQTTCGRWSPSRPGLVFIGTVNGFVQVWDLLDRSHQPILVHAVIKDAITCIEFRPLMTAQNANLSAAAQKRINAHQTIALGTKTGGFHFYELPRTLIRGPSAELKLAKLLFDRETRRVHYYSWRWDERRKEMEMRAAAVSVPAVGQENGADESAATGSPAAGGGAAAASQQKKDKKNNKDKNNNNNNNNNNNDDLLGVQSDEAAGDFVFTAEDDNQYLQLVEDLAKADTRMQAFLNAGKNSNGGKNNQDGDDENADDGKDDKKKKKK